MQLRLTFLLLALAAMFWGGTFVAGRQLAPVLAPTDAAFLRFVIAAALLLAWTVVRHGRLPALDWRQFGGVLLLGATGVVAYNLFFFAGLATVEAGRAALIIALNPILIAAASAWLLHERLAASRILGILVSVAGAIVVIARGDLATLVTFGVGHGELLILGCTVSWTAYTLIGRRLLHGMSPLATVTYAGVSGAAMLGVLQLARDKPLPLATLGAGDWAGILYLALFGTVLAFVWYYRGVHAIGPARAGQFINLVPVSGVAFGAGVLDEPVTASVIVGGALVLIGLWLTNRPISTVSTTGIRGDRAP